jgi:hypothetical protein
MFKKYAKFHTESINLNLKFSEILHKLDEKEINLAE